MAAGFLARQPSPRAALTFFAPTAMPRPLWANGYS